MSPEDSKVRCHRVRSRDRFSAEAGRSTRKTGGQVQGAGITLTRLTIGVSGPLALPGRCSRRRRLRRSLH